MSESPISRRGVSLPEGPDRGPGGPIVSVVTPCLNPGPRLTRCLDSVAGQTYPHVEHIVVDGGSTDGTLALLRPRRGLRWISEPDGGQSEAINKGLRMAAGEIVTWLNADDTLVPEAVEWAVEPFRADPAVGWVYGKVLTTWRDRSLVMEPPVELGPESFDQGNPIPQQGTFLAAWALRRVGYLDETLHLAMDFDLWVRLVDAGIVSAHVPRTMGSYEIHEGSKSGTIPWGDFQLEEGTALLKSGRARLAAQRLDRWYWWSAHREIDASLTAGRYGRASREAEAALRNLDPVLSRRRLSLALTRRWPRMVRVLKRLRPRDQAPWMALPMSRSSDGPVRA